MLTRTAGNQISGEALISNVVTSVANTDGIITVAAVADKRHTLHKLVWSYSAAPTGGGITVSGGAVTLDIDVTAAGPGSLSINYLCAVNTAMVVTIKAGSGTVVGKLYIERITQS